MDWEAFEFSIDEPEEEEEPSGTEEQEESTQVPDSWTELDALVLEGSGFPYRSIVEALTEKLDEERPQVTLEAKTSGSQCLVLWLRHQEEPIDDDEAPDEDFSSWIESTVQSIIKLSTDEVIQQPEEEEVNDKIDEAIEVTGEAETPVQEDKTDEEELPSPEPMAVEEPPFNFRFVTDPTDKEKLVHHLTKPAPEEEDPEQIVDELATDLVVITEAPAAVD